MTEASRELWRRHYHIINEVFRRGAQWERARSSGDTYQRMASESYLRAVGGDQPANPDTLADPDRRHEGVAVQPIVYRGGEDRDI